MPVLVPLLPRRILEETVLGVVLAVRADLAVPPGHFPDLAQVAAPQDSYLHLHLVHRDQRLLEVRLALEFSEV